MPDDPRHRIEIIELIENAQTSDDPLITQDRETALRDLTQDSFFKPLSDEETSGPYRVSLSIEENRLVFRMRTQNDNELPLHVLSLKPYQRLIKDYFMIVQSYNDAVAQGHHSKIEAVDMARRGIHNEGANLLLERLEDKIAMDLETARRIFTLICALHSHKAIMWR